MSDRELVRAWLEQAEDDLSYGEDILPPDTIGDATLEQLDAYIARAITQAQAARQVKTWLEQEIASRLGPNRKVRYGEWLYSTYPRTVYKIRADARRSFWDKVYEYDFAERLFNPNQARITALRELGQRYRGVDEDTGEIREGLAEFIEDHMDVEERPELRRQQLGAKGTPKYAEKMDEGVIE